MNKTLFGLIAIVCLTLATMTFSLSADDMAASMKPSGLVDDLTKKFNISPEQATGAAGAVFSMAKSKLSADDFAKVASHIPEMDSLLKAAPAVSGATSAMSGAMGSAAGGAAGLLSQFSGLGINAETAAKIAPEVLKFVKGHGGGKVADMLSKAIK